MASQGRYQDIANDLRTAILRGTYRPGQALPTELEFSAQYGTSRPTIRQAIRVLRAEGWLEAQRGRGTFVSTRRRAVVRYQPQLPRGGPYHTAHGGMAGTNALVLRGVNRIPADWREATWLGVPEGTEIVVRNRFLLSSDQEPLQTYDSYLPRDLVDETPMGAPSLAHGGTYRALYQSGLVPQRCTEEISARMPTPEEVAALKLGERTPVLEAVRITSGTVKGITRTIEALHIVASADRNVLVFGDLPIDPDRL